MLFALFSRLRPYGSLPDIFRDLWNLYEGTESFIVFMLKPFHQFSNQARPMDATEYTVSTNVAYLTVPRHILKVPVNCKQSFKNIFRLFLNLRDIYSLTRSIQYTSVYSMFFFCQYPLFRCQDITARTTKCHSQRLTLDSCCAFVPCNWCANSGAATRRIKIDPTGGPNKSCCSVGRSGELQMKLMFLASYTYLFVVFARLAVWTIGVLQHLWGWKKWTTASTSHLLSSFVFLACYSILERNDIDKFQKLQWAIDMFETCLNCFNVGCTIVKRMQ